VDDTREWLAASIREHATPLASGVSLWLEAASGGGGPRPTRADAAKNALEEFADWLCDADPARIVTARMHVATVWGAPAGSSDRAGAAVRSAVVEILREAGIWDAAGVEHSRGADRLLTQFFCEPFRGGVVPVLPSIYTNAPGVVPKSGDAPPEQPGWGGSPRAGGSTPHGMHRQEKIK